ncbi:MAG: bifunctional riboflavin kinase/FAD synthetase [Chloroflexota bacterium]
MQVIHHPSDVTLAPHERTIVTIGSYDGVHLGHKHIIASLQQRAAKHQVKSAIIAFHPRPAVIFQKSTKPDYLTTIDEKQVIFSHLGMDIAIIMPFSHELAQYSAKDFLEEIITNLHPLELFVGADFRFGKGREGDIALLTKVGEERGFSVQPIDLQRLDGERVSSTRIRSLLVEGNVRQATTLLGDYPHLTGPVIKGAQRGRTLGFPTANIAIHPEKLLPRSGVYAVWITVGDQTYAAVANVGVRPTFEETITTIEVHIFDFDHDIYEQVARVDWVEYIRPERRFDGIESLIAQIQADSQQAKTILLEERARPPFAGA